jgi:hypothetical protein
MPIQSVDTLAYQKLSFLYPPSCFPPGLHIYRKKVISSYTGCLLENATISPAKESMYSFPIDNAMPFLHINGYSVGTNLNFALDKTFFIATCGMCTFFVAKPVAELSVNIYAQALLMIILRFDITHTIVLDVDKKLNNTYHQMCKLLDPNIHTNIGGNHDPMLVECVDNYLNKGLQIFTQDQGTPVVSREAALLLIYARKSYGVSLTNISRAIVVTGQHFSLLINFSNTKDV